MSAARPALKRTSGTWRGEHDRASTPQGHEVFHGRGVAGVLTTEADRDVRASSARLADAEVYDTPDAVTIEVVRRDSW